MRFEEHAPDHAAVLRHLEDEGLSPWVEMNRWRRRFWMLVAVDVAAAALIWLALR
jgi:hypothetical protein